MLPQKQFEDFLPSLRRWQVDALNATHRILCEEDKPHLYVSAPTASGKSRYMFEACESLPHIGERVILVGINQIVEQHRDSFKEFGCYPQVDTPDCMTFSSPNGHVITITTWQALGRLPPRPIALLCFDECHIGAATDDAKTVRRIIQDFQPTKMISISATTQTANEGILGVKKGHLYRYSYAEAYEDGILNPVDLVEVHTGINADIEQVQDFTGQNMSALEEITSPDLEKLSEELNNRAVAYGRESLDVATAISKIVRNRHKNMSQIYLSDHVGEQAIFFSPNINAVEKATADFNSLSRQLGLGVRAEFCHSKVDDASGLIRRFKNGDIVVMFVVGMLQEGFDLDTLRLGFDCRFHSEWNPGRIARFIQRMGRLMRLSEGKQPSKYYFARDITHFYNQTALDPSVPMLVEDFEGETTVSSPANDVDTFGDLGIFGARVFHEMETKETDNVASAYNQQIDVFESVVTELEVNDRGFDDEAITPPGVKKIKLITTPLYVLKRVRGHAIVQTFSVATLFGASVGETVEQNIQNLITRHAAGEIRPSEKSNDPETKRMGRILSNYINDLGRRSNPKRYYRIITECQRWFAVDQMEESIQALIARHAAGENRPSCKSSDPEIRRLATFLTNHTKRYRDVNPQRYARIMKECPRWFVDDVEANIQALITRHAAGESKPNRASKDPETKRLGLVFTAYIRASGVTANPARYARLLKECPRWFVDEVEANIQALITRHAAGGSKPNAKSKDSETKRLGRFLKRCTERPDRYARLVKECPRWFVDQVEANIQALIASHSVGNPRPNKRSNDPETKRLGMILNQYASSRGREINPDRYARIVKECSGWFVDQVEENIQALITRYAAGESRPSLWSKDPETKRLAALLGFYLSNPDRCYRLKGACPGWFVDQIEENVQELIARYATGEERPSPKSEDPETRRLGYLFSSYVSKDGRRVAERYARLVKECPRWFMDREEKNIQALITKHAAGEKRPSVGSKDQNVKRLAGAFTTYIGKDGREAKPDRYARLVRECPRWFK